MATALIAEYETMAGSVPCAQEPATATQSVTYTTATASSAFNAKTKFVRIIADAKVHFAFGGAAATASSPYIAADTPEYFGVDKGITVSFYDGSS